MDALIKGGLYAPFRLPGKGGGEGPELFFLDHLYFLTGKPVGVVYQPVQFGLGTEQFVVENHQIFVCGEDLFSGRRIIWLRDSSKGID
jgi:hypothetical protein